jgi:threonine aldolase
MPSSRIVDLRTDTSTLPTDEMREAMARAEVGNDSHREDPTVNRLEALAAEGLGKEAALFVPSGCMGNLVALLAQSGTGRSALIGTHSHIDSHTAPALAQFGGVMTVPIDDTSGAPDREQVQDACRRTPGRAAVLALENTHNRWGGRVMPPGRVAAYGALAAELGLRLHLDGARIFNAAVALGAPAAEIAAPVHSVMFCLSKGLCAPVGSMFVSDEATVDRARGLRKLLGGQMRQAGVLAAAGIVALEQMVPRLAEDHAHARRLAAGLQSTPGLAVEGEPETNLVMVHVTAPGVTAKEFAARAWEAGVRAFAVGPDRIRFCLYRDITAEDVDHAVATLRSVAGHLSTEKHD